MAMKKILMVSCIIFLAYVLRAANISVTPANYETAYANAVDGDILLLDAGTYSAALEFPVGKIITLKKSAEASSMPLLTFAWATTNTATAGSGLILDGLEISLNADYYINFAASSIVEKFIFKNCTIGNINRCLIRATNLSVELHELVLENCLIKDCGANGYCFIWSRGAVNSLTVKNSTMYNYGGEGFFLAQNNDQTNAFSFSMQNNTIFKSGKDGSANYGWCSILVNYAGTSTYNISNNIFYKPFTTADTRMTIVVPAGSGTVTCKNNLVIDYPNFSNPPAAGWDLANLYTGTQNIFKDTLNRDFTLGADFSYKGTDGNYLGDPRWWPGQGGSFSVRQALPEVKAFLNNDMLTVESSQEIQQIELFDLKGNKLLAKPVCGLKTATELPAISNGLYLLKVKTGQELVVRKINIRK